MKCQRPEEARQHYEALLQQIPNSPLGCLGLGEALASLGDSAKALEVWRRGLVADPTNVPISFRIAEMLLQRGDLAAAAVPIDSLEQTISRMAAQPGAETNETVRALRPAVELLRAQWLLGQGQESAAEGQLQRIVNAGSDQVRQDSTALPTLQAWLLLGERYTAQSRWDQAAAAYQSAAELAPDNSAARLGAAVALGALGQFDPAIRHCRELLAKENPPPRTYLELARLEWRRQLSLPAEQRQSQTVQEALSAAETAADNWELRLLRADVLAAAGTSDATEQAVAVLKAAEQAYSDVAPLWLQLALRYQAWERPADAERAFAEYERRSAASPGTVVGKVQWLAARGELDAAERLLEEAWQTSPAGEQSRRALLLAEWHRRRRAGDKARTVLSDQLKRSPDDMPLLVLAADWRSRPLTMRTRSTASESCATRGPDGSYWKLCRARRLALQSATAAAGEFQQARQLCTEIQMRVLPGRRLLYCRQLAERMGDQDQAIRGYQSAVRLGERGIGVLERLIRMLYDQRRFAEAEGISPTSCGPAVQSTSGRIRSRHCGQPWGSRAGRRHRSHLGTAASG